jgi:hypothetical protein
MPTAPVAVDSNKRKLYRVPIIGDIQTSLKGDLRVYATSEDEAVAKVQEQIDHETVDNDIEMDDSFSGYTMSYADLIGYFGNVVEVDESGVELVEEDVDLDDVLEEEVEQLQTKIVWDTDALAKHKAFLESLLNENDSEQAVAA